jgi:UDP-glucose 4-epimerase
MAILVTGGAGYIGSHMVHELVDAGEDVVVLDDLSTGFPESVPPNLVLSVGDVGDPQLVSSLIVDRGVTDIIHFAASTVVPDSVRDPLSYYQNNTCKSRSLIEVAVRQGVRNLIFSSTAAVYGNPLRNPVAEDDPTNPVSPYGASKLMTEAMLRDTAQAFGIRYVILRYFNVAGADSQLRTGQSTARATHLIKAAVQTALGVRPKLNVFGADYPTPDGTCIRDYIHVSDLARAHLDALRYLRAKGASITLNCGYGRGFSVLEVVNSVRAVAGIDFPTEYAPRRAGDPAQVVAAADRIRAVLGWEPRLDDLRVIVHDALAWEQRLLTARTIPWRDGASRSAGMA